MGSIWGMNAWELIKMGGPLMVPILLCSLFALGIVIEKLIHFSMIQTNVLQLKSKVFALIKGNQIKEAIQTGRLPQTWATRRQHIDSLKSRHDDHHWGKN